jgi:phage terminase small subunit
MQELQQFIKVNGRTYDSEAGLKKIRPEVSILSDHTKDFRGFVNLLGLAPSSRVGAKIVDSENDEIESIT